MLRWPGHIKPGTVSNEIVSHLDMLPTLLAAACEPKLKEKLLKGHAAAKTSYICVPTRISGPTSPPTATTNGFSTGCS
jgi:arylsulfatase A-like enzyme